MKIIGQLFIKQFPYSRQKTRLEYNKKNGILVSTLNPAAVMVD